MTESGMGVAVAREIEARSRFAPSTANVGPARRFVADTLRSWGRSALIHDAMLLTSEVVTNAIEHVGSEVEVTVVDRGDRVLVLVRDDSNTLPWPRTPSRVAEKGRGLLVLEAMSDAWGTLPLDGGKHVWFELDTAQGQVGPDN